jgi:hypothetical protein
MGTASSDMVLMSVADSTAVM